MTRHLGAFIQNIFKPLIEELDEVLGKCKYLGIDKESIYVFLKIFTEFGLCVTIIRTLTFIYLGTLLFIAIWVILK